MKCRGYMEDMPQLWVCLMLHTVRPNTRYPLYFLVVQTNVNYQVAAVIVCQEETAEMITEALRQIKGK